MTHPLTTRFDKILDKGSKRLFQHLTAFFPTHAKWAVAEASLVMCVASAAIDLKYLTYPEVSITLPKGKKLGKIDLIIHTRKSHKGKAEYYWIESKRIYAEKNVVGVLKDIQRIRRRTQLRHARLPPHIEKASGAAVFIAITHKKKVADWWKTYEQDPPWDSLKKLRKHLREAQELWSLPMMRDPERPENKNTYVLGAIWLRE